MHAYTYARVFQLLVISQKASFVVVVVFIVQICSVGVMTLLI